MMDRITYIEQDNLKYMKSLPDDFFDIAIADPEQGKKMHGGKSCKSSVKQKNGNSLSVKDSNYVKKDWDNSPASKQYFKELFRVSKHQIIWGEQYYHQNFGHGRIVWDKLNDGADQYDCEIAYTSLTDRVIIFRFIWRGMMQGKSMSQGHIQQGNKKLNDPRIHPTQKPILLYVWLLKKFQIPLGWKIFDPNLGSGSIGIACLRTGHELIGCENDTAMYIRACNWLNAERDKLERNLEFNFIL